MSKLTEISGSGLNRAGSLAWSALITSLVLAAWAGGCALGPNGNDNGNDNGTGNLSGNIINITSNVRVSGNQAVTVLYNAEPTGTSVSAFTVPMSGLGDTATPVGPAVVFATGLPTGQSQSVTLNTGSLAVGIYKVGLNLVGGSGTLQVVSVGTVQVTTLPTPVFELPDQNLSVTPGTYVDIRASLGSPENAVQWRVFYIEASASTSGTPAGQLGTQIAIGQANEAVTTWNTTGVALGTYKIGISVTDSGQSVAQTSAAGDEDKIITEYNDFAISLVSTPSPPLPPTVAVSQPAADQLLFGVGTVLMQFRVTVYEGPENEQKIDAFYDFDGRADTGDEHTFSGNLPITATSAVFSTALIQDGQTVHLGIVANDGKNEAVTRYAAGEVSRGTPAAAFVTVTQPNSSLPSKPGETINVAWTTNVPSSTSATVDVFRRRTNSSGAATGSEIAIKTPTAIAQAGTTASFVADQPGRYEVTVRIILSDKPNEPISGTAPKLVAVSTLPAIFWLGELAKSASNQNTISGAVFEGVQFEDNAGSSFEGNEDFNSDNVSEFLITSRYAKPDFVNPTGVGQGEVYIFRGRSGVRYAGTVNLNAVGTATAPGMVATGIQPPTTTPVDTDGIGRLFITGDADGDGVGEIVFGMPKAGSQWSSNFPLTDQSPDSCPGNVYRDPTTGARIPQFHRGGVVIVSSLNQVFGQTNWDQADVSIVLDNVGQTFESTLRTSQYFTYYYQQVSPEPEDGSLCPLTGSSEWMENAYTWIGDDNSKCPPDASCMSSGGSCPSTTCYAGCVPLAQASGTTDTENDVMVHPRFGFDQRLADPWPCLFLYWMTDDSTCVPAAGCPASDPLDSHEAASGTCTASDPATCCDADVLDPIGPLCCPVRDLTGGAADCGTEVDLLKQQLPIGIVGLKYSPYAYRSGYYRENLRSDGTIDYNDIVQSPSANNLQGLIGARIIGEEVNDACGMSITQSDEDLILSSPFSSPLDLTATSVTTNGGSAYAFAFDPWPSANSAKQLPLYWMPPTDYSPNDYPLQRPSPPRPHQYLVGGFSNNGVSTIANSRHSSLATVRDFRILGDENELIQNIVGIPDFNGDTRGDVAIGAPRADVNDDGAADGAVYIIFRRAIALEGDYELKKLKLSTSNVERLAGVLVRETYSGGQRFGESVAGDIDFNGDGEPDVVIGNPDGNKLTTSGKGTGEVVIIFSSSSLISQAGGIPVEDEGSTPGLLRRLQGARIRGVEAGSEFGVNVANIGDIDGDGKSDLAIAAPNATPMHDGNPFDTVDQLDTPGLDLDLDGVTDDVSGRTGVADGRVDEDDNLVHAGLVYVILSSTSALNFAANGAPLDISVSQLGSNALQGFILVGRHGERYQRNSAGAVITPVSIVYEGDFLGGGEAGSDVASGKGCDGLAVATGVIDYGGNCNKKPEAWAGLDGVTLTRSRGRSYGLSWAGDVDGDGFDDFLVGAQLADPRIDPVTGEGTRNGGEAYLIYGFEP